MVEPGLGGHLISGGLNFRGKFVQDISNSLNGHLGVEPKIGGKPPKWMVKIIENPIKMDDLGGKPPIFGNTHLEVNDLVK